ncbi:MAG TPA: carboxypeptidase-like regulatory domain-containing protein [Saprospiraceae bacterium]|nr:carboxypeptidase-like regulatory domain-containing protein [Saprospiraceae bacterium]
MTRYLFLLILIHISNFTFGQVGSLILKNEIRGTVVDRKTNRELQFATVFNLSLNLVADTNEDGNFTLEFKNSADTIITFYLGYKPDTTIVSKLKEVIYLEPIQNLIAEIEITDNRNARMINNPKFAPIKFVASDSLIYLLSMIQSGFKKNYELEIFRSNGVSVKKIPIAHVKKMNILLNCQNEVFLHIDDECIKIVFENQQLTLIEKMTFRDYQSLFDHCLASKEDVLIYEKARWNDLEKHYFLVNLNEGKSALITSVIHDQRLQSYKHDLGFIDYGKKVSTMEITSEGNNRFIRNQQADSHFLEVIFHKNHTDNYFFALDSGFVFFNFDEKLIEFYNPIGGLKQTILDHQIFNSKSKNYCVLQDKLSKKLYYVQERHNDLMVSEIEFGTGSISDGIALDIVFYESIAVVGGNLFVQGRKSLIEDYEVYYKRLE